MMCCRSDHKTWRDKVNIKSEETEDGIQWTVSPKDKSKVESFKAMVRGCRDLCDCGC